MKLLANENFPLASVRILSESGFDIKSISVTDPGTDDETVMKIAIDENRTIITFDRDYGQLIFKKVSILYMALYIYDGMISIRMNQGNTLLNYFLLGKLIS